MAGDLLALHLLPKMDADWRHLPSAKTPLVLSNKASTPVTHINT